MNSNNFEFVCLDMAPGYSHKGVCRAGLLALDSRFEEIENSSSYSDLSRKEKRVRMCQSSEDAGYENCMNGMSISNSSGDLEYSYEISFLSKFLDNERDHYTSLWSSSNCIGQREMRGWLSKLWFRRPELRELIWKVFLI